MPKETQGEESAKHFARDEPCMDLPIERNGEGHPKAPSFRDVWRSMAINDHPRQGFEVEFADV